MPAFFAGGPVAVKPAFRIRVEDLEIKAFAIRIFARGNKALDVKRTKPGHRILRRTHGNNYGG